MSIPDGREDAAKALCDREWWRGSMTAEEIVAVVADTLRFAPLGDNHHNAALCPYCRPDYEREIDRAASKLHLAVVSPEVTRDLADQIWEVAEGKYDSPHESTPARLKTISARIRAIKPVR